MDPIHTPIRLNQTSSLFLSIPQHKGDNNGGKDNTHIYTQLKCSHTPSNIRGRTEVGPRQQLESVKCCGSVEQHIERWILDQLSVLGLSVCQSKCVMHSSRLTHSYVATPCFFITLQGNEWHYSRKIDSFWREGGIHLCFHVRWAAVCSSSHLNRLCSRKIKVFTEEKGGQSPGLCQRPKSCNVTHTRLQRQKKSNSQ